MKENIFKQARLHAAEKNKDFRTAESAALQMHNISREKMYMIEQEDPTKRQVDPTPFDVMEMARAYGAPELCDHYCSQICPIGLGRKPLMHQDLGEISAKLMAALHFLQSTNDDIHRVLADSQVTEDEKAKFKAIIQTLREISFSAESLDLWARKNGYVD